MRSYSTAHPVELESSILTDVLLFQAKLICYKTANWNSLHNERNHLNYKIDLGYLPISVNANILLCSVHFLRASETWKKVFS